MHGMQGKHENYTTLLENDNNADASETWLSYNKFMMKRNHSIGSARKNIPLNERRRNAHKL